MPPTSKLSIVSSSISVINPYKWVRRLPATLSPSAAPRNPRLSLLQSSVKVHTFRISQVKFNIIMPSTKLPPLPAQDNKLVGGLDFRGQRCLHKDHNSDARGGGVVDEIGTTTDNHPSDRSPHHSEKLLTLPTMLTIARVAAVPVLISTFYVNSGWGPNATTSIFVAAAATDWLDGYIARKLNLKSTFGAFLDPVADKLMVAATLVLLCTRPLEVAAFGNVPWLLAVPSIAIIGREITMSAVREWAASQNSKLGEAVAVNNLGKWKTATQMIALTILLATRDSSLTGLDSVVASGVVLLYVSAGLAVWSLVVYMRKILKVLLK
ncbi:CDP-diacylglycerol--glycerol-3-phosphate 3-phosphatidyltransferase 2 [Impatiens glandulifera]|uniref:CDP-diacylglycerol--glycerol-3-phosphate 3-phosphatidyltransferase 2 n=1 Tax=Impatiens glandulifera TaxID=253017 RepID=UPI001FB0C3CC|nr:CDP-diacylglycerol--glycerol-3-phosphate 3-phosphatidyltransferase 2 [Impatiens glandulifera]